MPVQVALGVNANTRSEIREGAGGAALAATEDFTFGSHGGARVGGVRTFHIEKTAAALVVRDEDGVAVLCVDGRDAGTVHRPAGCANN